MGTPGSGDVVEHEGGHRSGVNRMRKIVGSGAAHRPQCPVRSPAALEVTLRDSGAMRRPNDVIPSATLNLTKITTMVAGVLGIAITGSGLGHGRTLATTTLLTWVQPVPAGTHRDGHALALRPDGKVLFHHSKGDTPFEWVAGDKVTFGA